MPAVICTSFKGHQRIASGPLQTVALVVKRELERDAAHSVLIFDDANGQLIDIDLRGSDEDVVARLAQPTTTDEPPELVQTIPEPAVSTMSAGDARTRGRPKLGVVPREVTLLPRHWEWLASQPGGASVALRKLVDEARRTHSDRDRNRQRQERAYRFIRAIAGNLPQFEEATRALFANDEPRFTELVAEWPKDIRDYAIVLAFGEGTALSTTG